MSLRTEVAAGDIRLVFSGTVLRDGHSLVSYGIEVNKTVHMLTNATSSGGGKKTVTTTFGAMPAQYAGMHQLLLQNPDIMQQMMNSPAMQSLLNNPELLRSMLNVNPNMKQLMERNPGLANMLADTDFLQGSLEAFRNPSMMREAMRSTDRALSNIECIPGGFDTLRNMFAGISTQNPSLVKVPKASDDGSQEEKPAWVGQFDPNAMAAMMQDPNMQQLMASLFQAKGTDPAGGAPFSDPNFLASMFSNETMKAMAQMQQAMANMALSGGGAAPGFGPSSAASDTPAASFSTSFQNYLQAQSDNPELRFKAQLSALRNMGFTNPDYNIAALTASEGHLNKAIDALLAEHGMP